jgi:phosphatidylglycerophosphate synthase
MKWVQEFRKKTDHILLKLPLPKINPNILSALSVVTSLFFVMALNYSSVLALIIFIISFSLDLFDGLVAKKHKMTSENGYIVDIICDRISEGILFIPFFNPWFYLFALNNLLTVVSFVRYKHTILPLRFAFMIYFIFYLI